MMNRARLPLLRLLIAIVALGVFTSGVAKQSPPVQVAVATDLARVGAIADARKLPILLVFSAHHCSFCVLLEEEILKPMLLSGDYDDRVMIYKVMLDEAAELRNFNGNTVTADALASHYDVFVTPTMLFLDANGTELSERLLGINTVEMFGGLVDEAIDISHAQLRANNNHLARHKPATKQAQ